MCMTPFKIKVSVDHYEEMGYKLKIKDILYCKKKDGRFDIYAELIDFDKKQNCWIGKAGSIKSLPVSTVNSYIEIVVIPFEQYTKKSSERATFKRGGNG